MSAIKLSICIPTYNREAHLRKALGHCEAHFDFTFPYEIVISDNASTDNTSSVVEAFIAKGLPIRYHRRAVNGGAGPNLTGAFHHAVGEYSVYLADDDLLIPNGVKAAVAYLDAHPDVTVCHAPWYLHDEVAKKDLSQFYAVDADREFSQGSFAEVFQFIYERHIFPEIAIYRASSLRAAWVPRDFCFWAFTNLAHFLDQGSVAFLKTPFYRSVVVSEIDQGRQQLGFEEVMTAWDKYRGGLEYFVYTGVKRGKIRNTRETRLLYEEKIKTFTLNRMAVAVRFWAARKDYLKAYELYTRMAIGGMGEHPEVAKLRDVFPIAVALQTLAYHVNAAAGVDRVILSGMSDPGAIGDMLRSSGLAPQVEIAVEPQSHDPTRLERTAVFVADAPQRQKFLALGYKPNLIFTDSDLVQHTII